MVSQYALAGSSAWLRPWMLLSNGVFAPVQFQLRFGHLCRPLLTDCHVQRDHPANDVHVTGTFDDWSKSVQLIKKGPSWEKEVNLPSADSKIYYKVWDLSRLEKLQEHCSYPTISRDGIPNYLCTSITIVAPSSLPTISISQDASAEPSQNS